MAQANKAGPGGRPTKFKEEYTAIARNLGLLGLTDVELARAFGVVESTIYCWKQQHPQFSEALQASKDIADGAVAAKLFHRATGYSHPEVDVRVVNGQIVQTPLVKHYPPDTVAAIFWLKNRQRALWRDKPEDSQDSEEATPVPVNITVQVQDARKHDSTEPQSTAGAVSPASS